MSSEGPTQIFAKPCSESAAAPALDIFFVHGLGGDRIETWQEAEDKFWPRWLAEQFPNCRIYMIGYDSNKFAGFLAGEGASIQDLALSIADQIASREDSAPHALFVAHSLGGLVIKQMLRRLSESANTDYNSISRSVAGVAFFGTPHFGAQAATALDILLNRFKSKQVKQLAYSADMLIDLNEFFRTWVSRHGVEVRSYYETEKTGKIHIVDRVTANPGILGSDPIAVQSNHIDICKPSSTSAAVYASICSMIRKILKAISPSSEAGPSGSGDQGFTRTLPEEGNAAEIATAVAPDDRADFEYYTTMAAHDRRDLAQKLTDAGRSYAIPGAKRKKERFNMALQRHIAQPSAVIRYTRLMADVESRFERHVGRVIAADGLDVEVDKVVQEQVIDPCTTSHSSNNDEINAGLVDGALYYLAGNCHLAWDNG